MEIKTESDNVVSDSPHKSSNPAPPATPIPPPSTPNVTTNTNINTTHNSNANTTYKTNTGAKPPYIYGFLPNFELLDYPILFDRIDKRNFNDKRTELSAENEEIGAAIVRAAAAHPDAWYNAEIQSPKKTEVYYAIEDIFLPCTEKKCTKDIAHVQMHQPYKKGGRSNDNIAAHIVPGVVIEVLPSPKTPNIPRYNFVNMILDTVTPKVHFVSVPILGTLDSISTYDFAASQKVSPTQIVQVWWNFELALQLAGISEYNRLYRNLASGAAVRKAMQDPTPPPDPILGPQSRLVLVNQYRFLHLPEQTRTRFCETYLDATLRSDIAHEDRTARMANAAGTGNISTSGELAGREKEFEKRLDVLRARYMGYGESRAIHTQSQILERKKKRQDKLQTERAEREKDRHNNAIVLADLVFDEDSGREKRKRNEELSLSTTITKLVRVESGSPPLSPSHSPITPLSSPPSTPTISLGPVPVPASVLELFKDKPTEARVVSGNGAGQERSDKVEQTDSRVTSILARSGSVKAGEEERVIRLMVELEYANQKLERRKAATIKQKQEIQRLKEENERVKEMYRSTENKLGMVQDKCEILKTKYQTAKEWKHKCHELDIENVVLKAKAELHVKYKSDT